jgi:hypothetical protein
MATAYDSEMFLVQLHCTGRPAKGISEKTEQGTPLQSNQ